MPSAATTNALSKSCRQRKNAATTMPIPANISQKIFTIAARSLLNVHRDGQFQRARRITNLIVASLDAQMRRKGSSVWFCCFVSFERRLQFDLAFVNRERLVRRKRKLLLNRFRVSYVRGGHSFGGWNLERRRFQIGEGRWVGVDVIAILDCQSNNCFTRSAGGECDRLGRNLHNRLRSDPLSCRRGGGSWRRALFRFGTSGRDKQDQQTEYGYF